MKPTPTDTSCPPAGDLQRLLQALLPEAEAARLQAHLRDCLACRQVWHDLQRETIAGHTPPLLQPIGDTRPGPPEQLEPASVITWSSGVMLEGNGGERAAEAPTRPASADARVFPFLAPPHDAGEMGWLGHYRVTGVLGEGGMGFVFDAFDTHLHRRVALKVLKPELAANASFRERFLLEARAAAALPDEHIITIYQVGLENDVPFLAMKFLYGESLEQRLQHDGRLPTQEVLRIGREIALGLSAAHDRGLIHRDIKPANLWLETPPSEQGASSGPRLSFEHAYRVKVLDFGLARPINDDARRLTATGLIVGTPQYLAPEQARGQPLDHRCDLFSLGIVLYRMATGILPFDGADTLAQLTALAVADPPPVEALAPETPAGLRNVIHQLLERDPAKRPPTARAVAELLRAVEKGETMPAPASVGQAFQPDAVVGQAGKPDLRKATRRRGLLASGLLMIALLGGVLAWRGFRPVEGENAVSAAGKEPIRVGVLFSQRGPMANGGGPAFDAAQLAIDELNQQGGLLGRPVEAIMGDGESNYRKFAALAEKLITQDHVCVLFGTRASFNRKAVRPIVEKHDHLLIYPMQFEGLEDSPNIVYLGAAPNQQMIPAVDYFLEKGKRRLFLVGSDYVFPHAANAILGDYLGNKHPEARIVGEEYLAFGSSEVGGILQAIEKAKPDLIVNTINGDSNSEFFRALHRAGVRAERTPVLSFSMGENELLGLGDAGIGHYAAWSYFQGIDSEENQAFVRKFRARFGPLRIISDPMETVYLGVHIWARAVQAAGSVEPRAVAETIKGRTLRAPEGDVRVDGETRYTWRPMRLGYIQKDGRFKIIVNTGWALRPESFPSTRSRAAWERFLNDLYAGWGNRWQATP
ncbi:MAG TPA: transporter substrate-binding protein [Gemmataceae bacterium]|nr:transporter substrate-binding protein [Gemmataceae bacterium]